MAQKVVISENPPADFKKENSAFGPNQKKFKYLDFKIGSFSDYQTEKPLDFISSFHSEITTIKKRKISNLLALNYGLGYRFDNIQLHSDSVSYISITSQKTHDIRYLFHSISTIFGFQINFENKRGNQLGKYFSVNGYFNWNYRNKLTYKFSGNSNAEKTKVIHKNLNGINNFQYGVTAKLILKKIGLFIDYRISNIFKKSKYNLPNINAGFNFTISPKDFN